MKISINILVCEHGDMSKVTQELVTAKTRTHITFFLVGKLEELNWDCKIKILHYNCEHMEE